MDLDVLSDFSCFKDQLLPPKSLPLCDLASRVSILSLLVLFVGKETKNAEILHESAEFSYVWLIQQRSL
jgi:hypothetical protein